MGSPLIYFGIHAIKSGMVEVAREASKQLGAFVEANHSRILHFEIYIDDAAEEMVVVQVHPDEDSLRLHIDLAKDQISQAYSFLEGTTKIEIFGSPSEAMRSGIQQMAMGAPVRINEAVGGFSRLGSVSV